MQPSLKDSLAEAGASALRMVLHHARPGFRKTEPKDARRFLFLHYNYALGTSLNSAPIFEALKLAIPDCEIALATSSLSYEVFRHHRFIDHVVRTPDVATDFGGSVDAIHDFLRASAFRPDYTCIDSANGRSKIGFLAHRVSNCPVAGYSRFEGLLDRPLTFDVSLSHIANNLRLLSIFGHRSHHREPRLFFSPEDLARARTLLRTASEDDHRPMAVLVTQVSGTQPTAWFAERFARLAEYLYRSMGFRIVLVGSGKDSPAIDALLANMNCPALSVAGKTDIPVLGAVLATADLAVSVDTGVMHAIRAMQVPMVLLASAWEEPHIWLPPGQPHIQVLRSGEIACRHCHKSVCQTRECMDEIATDHVVTAVRQVLATHPPSASARAQRIARALWSRDGATAEQMEAMTAPGMKTS